MLSNATRPEPSRITQVLTQISEPANSAKNIQRVLNAVRSHLNMQVGFVSEFTAGQRVFRFVDTDGRPTAVRVGGSAPLDSGYCKKVVDGVLPQMIADTSLVPETAEIPETLAFPIGSHVSVPIYLQNGKVFGTFCCFNAKPESSLNQRDLEIMRALSDIVAGLIEEEILDQRRREEVVHAVSGFLTNPTLIESYFQPIFSVLDNSIIGIENLSRFNSTPTQPPDVWLSKASQVGLEVELQLACVKKATSNMARLPADSFMSINLSPLALLQPEVIYQLSRVDPKRLVIEITEHTVIDDYETLKKSLGELRRSGMRIAVDDAGAGFASFRHILLLHPEIIKLDMSLVRSIDRDSDRQSLARSLLSFSRQTGSKVVAEGVETQAELSELKNIGIEFVQGYLLGRPATLDGALDQIARCNRRKSSR